MVRGPRMADGQVRGLAVAGRDGGDLRVDAPITIAADGASSRLARALSLSHHAARPRRWAAGAYFEGVTGMSGFGEMHVRSHAYIGVAPLPDHLANACVVTADRRAAARPGGLAAVDTLQRDPVLSARFAQRAARDSRDLPRPTRGRVHRVRGAGTGVGGRLGRLHRSDDR